MGPERCASELSKLIARLSRAGKLPENWTSSSFVSLVNAYSELVKVAGQISTSGALPGTDPETDVDAIMNAGRPGAYEEMVERAKSLERSAKEKKFVSRKKK